LAKRDGSRCAYCDREFVDLDDATLDHVIPNSILRHWDEWNLLLACSACNHLKADQVPLLLMPLFFHLLSALLPTVPEFLAQQEAQHAAMRLDLHRRKAAKRLGRNRELARQRKAMVNKAVIALTGAPMRLAIEAAPVRAALPAGQGGQR
jgi:hypothetical protein